MVCRSATAVLLLLSLVAVAHSRPIEADPATSASSAVAVPTEVLPSSDDVSTDVVPTAGQESGLLHLPSDHSVVVYHQVVEAEDLGRQKEEAVQPVAEPDPDRAQPAGIDGEEELTNEPSTDGHEAEEEEELSHSHHDEDEKEEEKATKRLRHRKDDDDSDSDSDSDDDDDDDLEEKAKRWMKALKMRWFGHRKHHRHAHGETRKQAHGKQEESGVMTWIWIKGLVMNRF